MHVTTMLGSGYSPVSRDSLLIYGGINRACSLQLHTLTELKLCLTFKIIQRSCRKVQMRLEESTFVVLTTSITSSVLIWVSIDRFHMTSRRPYWWIKQ